MNKQELINAAHAAQNDAGSQINFNKKVTFAENAMYSGSPDPVAAFLAALLLVSQNDIQQVRESIGYYFDELSKVHKALSL